MKKLVYFLLFVSTLASGKTYNILNYGAVGDSATLNTIVIQKTIDFAAANGGGEVYIPKGRFRSGALFFKPKTTLKIAKGGVLLGSDEIKDYPFGPSRMEGQSLPYFTALINADGVDNFTISGGGTIDGNGLRFWKAFWERRKENPKCTNLEVSRPRLVFIQNAKNITIKNVFLRNSGFWTTHLYKCRNILIQHCDIRSPFEPVKAPSTDAIDLDVCSDVVISRCYFSVNDDAVTIKGGKGPYADVLPENGIVENVLVERCTFGRSHGCITLGSECIHAKNIMIRNCKFETDTITPLLRLKLRPDTPQLYEDISVEGCSGFVGRVIEVKPWTQFYDLKDRKTQPTAHIRNINFRKIKMEIYDIGCLIPNPNDTVQTISFDNCNFIYRYAFPALFVPDNHPEFSYKNFKIRRLGE